MSNPQINWPRTTLEEVSDCESGLDDLPFQTPTSAAARDLHESGKLPSILEKIEISAGRDTQGRQKEHVSRDPPKTLDQCTAFWKAYHETSEAEDREFVKSASDELDVLLVFAGLFSSTSTTFIIESYKKLSADPMEETNRLLRALLLATQNPASVENNISPPSFKTNHRDIRINALFFTSLCCSLSVAFAAVLAKQWVNRFDHERENLPAERGRERQQKYDGLEGWGLQDIVETLPTLLQLSLFSFLVGLIDFLWPLDYTATAIVIAFTVATFVFYLITTSISTIIPKSPFQTRLTVVLHSAGTFLWTFVATKQDEVLFKYRRSVGATPYWKRPGKLVAFAAHSFVQSLRQASFSIPAIFQRRTQSALNAQAADLIIQDEVMCIPNPGLDTNCIVYLLERITLAEDLDMVAGVLEFLTRDPGAGEIGKTLVTLHLKPLFVYHWTLPGLSGPMRPSLLRILHILIVKWGFCQTQFTIIHSSPPLTTPMLVSALRGELWRVYLMDPRDQRSFRYITEILSALPRPPFPCSPHAYFLMDGWTKEAAMKHLENDSDAVVQKHTLALLCVTADYFHPNEAWGILAEAALKSTGVRTILQSTMWKDSSSGVARLGSFWMATLRLQVVAATMDAESLPQDKVAQYLTEWVHKFSSGPAEPGRSRAYSTEDEGVSLERVWVYWTYQLTIMRLLTHKDGTWPEELARHGHWDRLRLILQDTPAKYPLDGAPLGLHLFLLCWNPAKSAVQGSWSPSVNEAKEWLKTIIEVLNRDHMIIGSLAHGMETYGGVYLVGGEGTQRREQVGEMMCSMMDKLLSYLKAAMLDRLLDKDDLDAAVKGYKRWCSMLDGQLATNRRGYGGLGDELARVRDGALASGEIIPAKEVQDRD